MSQLLRRAAPPGPDGTTIRVEPTDFAPGAGGTGWSWIGSAAHWLRSGQVLRRPADAREVGAIVLEGVCRVRIGGRSFGQVGSSASVFDAVPPPVVLVEPGATVEVEAVGPALVAIAAAPAGDLRGTRLIEPASMRTEDRGSRPTARTVRHLLPPDAAAYVDEMLERIPEFGRAYDPDGLRAEKFDTYGATVRTLRWFIASHWDLVRAIDDILLPNPDVRG